MAEREIWQRPIDYEKIDQRHKRFFQRFAIAGVIVYAGTLLLSGSVFGSLVPVVILGGIWGSAIRFQSLSDKANPTMVVDGGVLRLGRAEVFIEDVRTYTTMATEIQTSVFGKYSRINLGKAVFRLDAPGTRSEPKLVEFGWPNMQEDGVHSVKSALDGVLPDRWVEPAELVEVDELPKGRRKGPSL